MTRPAVLMVALLSAPCLALRSNSTTQFTVNDKISINGNTIAEGANIANVVGCNHAPQGSNTITVCGCGVKVEANLLTECQKYGKYSHTVGDCDCGKSGCVTHELTSGYTEKFKWEAASYKVE